MQSNSPLVSVIMPVKGCNPAFLEKSVESILNQTLTNIELLVVLDADQRTAELPTFTVLSEHMAKDSRLRIVYNKEKGFVQALNCGIFASKGEYIARMDADDISGIDRLKIQISTMDKMDLDIVGCWAQVIDDRDSVIGELTPPCDSLSIRRSIMLHNPFLHSAMLFKKSILLDSGVYNSALYGAEDYDLWLRIVSLGYKCANIPKYLVMLRETSNSVMRGNQWRLTRVNYAKVKVLGLVRLGYTDPLSFSSCLFAPFSLLIGPKIARNMKTAFGLLRSYH